MEVGTLPKQIDLRKPETLIHPDQKTCILTPETALNRLKVLGFEKWYLAPLGQSHYIDALVKIATSSEPLDLFVLMEIANAQRTPARNRK